MSERVLNVTYQEKSSIVSIFSTLIIFVFYYIYVSQMYLQGTESSTELLRYWGLVIILLVPVQIIIKIIITIVFNIINRIATNEAEPSITDELDKLINLKVTRNSCYGFLIVFFVAMGSLVLEMPISVMFNILFFGLVGSGIIAEISQFFYYRRGV